MTRVGGLRPPRAVLFEARGDQRIERLRDAADAARADARGAGACMIWFVISRLLSPSKIAFPVSRK